MTGQALIAINEFMSRYPHSEQIENFKTIKILTQRLHDKAYLNAYTYYKIGRYKSAIVSLKNALKQYPESSHREEIMYLIVESASYPSPATRSPRSRPTAIWRCSTRTSRSKRSSPNRSTSRRWTAWPSTPAIIWTATSKEKQQLAMEIKKNIPNNTITRKLVDLDRETGKCLRVDKYHRPPRQPDRNRTEDRAEPQARRLLIAHGHHGGDLREP